MNGFVALLYGGLVYVVFLGSFLYAILFVGGISQIGALSIPKVIDSGPAGPRLAGLIVDVILLGIFAVQHSLMARPAFKRAWTRIIPACLERSTYVLFASLALILVYWQWRALPGTVWTVTNSSWALVLQILFWLGWAIVLTSTFLIDHFELFGLEQIWAHARRREVPQPQFRAPLFYKVVRHPIYLGFLIAFWSTPVMTEGHLLFALATTGYIFIGIWFEERDLVAHFGEIYLGYRERVFMILPLPRPADKLRLRRARDRGAPRV